MATQIKMSDARKNKISEALIWRINEKGMTGAEAMDDLFGEGTFDGLASNLYDKLIEKQFRLTVV